MLKLKIVCSLKITFSLIMYIRSKVQKNKLQLPPFLFFLIDLCGKVKFIILNDIFNIRNKMHSIYDNMN